MALIKLCNAVKKYATAKGAVTALDGVSLEVEQGEFVAVMGPSGSGKSTLLNVLGLLDRPDSGEYVCAGSPTAVLGDDGLAALRGGLIGFVFQDFYALQELSAEENVALPLDYNAAGLDPAECLKMVELADRSSHRPAELSGGQQQRLAIARAMVRSPKLILADEPTGNLDPRLRDEILSLLEGLTKRGVAVLVVTHDPAVAARAGRVITMEHGRILADTGARAAAPAAAMAPVEVKRRAGSPLANRARAAAANLRRNKWRSALILSCFALGIASVIVSIGFTESFKKRLSVRLEAIDPKVINIYPVRMAAPLAPEDAALITANVPGVAAVNACTSAVAPVTAGDKSADIRIYAVPPARVIAKEKDTLAGRLPAAAPGDAASAVLLRRTAVYLFGSEEAAVGKQLSIGGAPFTVAGVLGDYSHEETRGEDPSAGILIQPAAAGVLKNAVPKLFEVVMAEEDRVPVSAWKIDGLLNPAGKKRFAVSQAKRFRDTLRRTTEFMRYFLLALSALPILLGAALVANTMLLSVGERRGEIGLRKALGARRRDIASQFLAESLMLYAAGGAAGALAGTAAVYALSGKIGVEPAFSAVSLFYGTLLVAAGGLLAGFWPAWRAASVDPIRALRGNW